LTVLRSAVHTIAGYRPLLSFENVVSGVSAALLVSALGELGYRLSWHLAPIFARSPQG
jgi:hypothetical protein